MCGAMRYGEVANRELQVASGAGQYACIASASGHSANSSVSQVAPAHAAGEYLAV